MTRKARRVKGERHRRSLGQLESLLAKQDARASRSTEEVSGRRASIQHFNTPDDYLAV